MIRVVGVLAWVERMVCKRVLRASMGDMGNSVAEILASMEWMAY